MTIRNVGEICKKLNVLIVARALCAMEQAEKRPKRQATKRGEEEDILVWGSDSADASRNVACIFSEAKKKMTTTEIECYFQSSHTATVVSSLFFTLVQ